MDQENADLEEPSEGEENVEDAEEMGEMTEEDDTEAEEEADVLKPGEDGEEEDEGETGGEEEGEGLELPPPEVEEVGEAEEEVQVIEEIPGEEVETFQEAVVQEAEVEEEEAEQEEEEEETEAEQEEEFTALRLSQGQGDFERASYEAEEGGEDEEFPNESPRQSLEKEEPLSEAAKEGTDAAEEPEVRESRPRIFVCGEAEKDRSLQVESYCCQQIKIPPLLPHVLKTYTKGAIKTQPRDLLRWSATYFRALANDEPPPVKERLEYPTLESPCGLTKGLLRILHKQLGKHEQVNEKDLREKWTGLCLDGAELTKLLHLNSLDSVFDWTKFIVVAAASVVKEQILETMTVFCEITTLQPDGVDPYIPYEVFAASYTFLADKMGVDVLQAATVCSFLRDLSTANFDLVGPRDFMAPECPDLY